MRAAQWHTIRRSALNICRPKNILNNFVHYWIEIEFPQFVAQCRYVSLLHNYEKNTECRVWAFVTSTDSCSNPNWVPQRSVSYRRRRRNEFIAVDVGAFYWKFLSISYVPIDLGLRMEWEIKCSAVFVCCIVDIFFFLLHFINTIATYKYKVHKRNIVKYSCWTLLANWL